MANARKKKDNTPRQEWDPPKIPSVLYKIWRVLFAIFKVAFGAAATVLLIAVVCVFVFVGNLGDFLEEDILPAAEIDMEGYDLEQNSYLYYVDSDGQIQIYQKVYASTSSQWVEIEDVPEDLIYAAVSIEDKRFFEHQGVDWITTIKATARMFFGDSSVGGSSITQQVIKNILLTEDDTADDVTVQRKLLEIFRAIQLEKRYDKETIMEMYLNVIYLGEGCRGVKSAASVYFGKEIQTLTTAECASLISITNNPSMFDPYMSNVFMYNGEEMNGMQRNRTRQMLVLSEMLNNGWITQEEYDEAVAQEIVLKNGIDTEDKWTECPNEECDYEDIFRNYVADGAKSYCPLCSAEVSADASASQSMYSWFTDTVLEDVAKDLAAQSGLTWNDSTKELMMQRIKTGGYHIYTTIDLEAQNQVDKIYGDLSQIPSTRGGQQLQSAIVVINNSTGDIVAMAGGVGEKTYFDEWNRATDSVRQSGSSIKPITVYAPAFEVGAITPATVITDLPVNYTNGAYPLNDNRRYSYSRTIYSGIVSSVNAVAANTLEMIGEKYSFEFAREKFGVTSLLETYTSSGGRVSSDIGIGPLALGAQTLGVTVREMANAFATFANDGEYRYGRTYTKVYDSEGNLILDNTQQTKQILSQKTVDYVNYCLSSATANGTGTEAKISGITTAGKTGTTGDNKDRWYCGYTGYYTAAVWTGYDTPATISGLSVNNPAAVLFKKVMAPLHKGKSNISLYNANNMTSVSVCLDSGKLATDACSDDVRVSLVSGFTRTSGALVYYEDVPTEYCDKHVEVDYCSGGGVATDYCKLFAEVDSSVKVSTKALVKMTQSEIDELLKAESYNLQDPYLMDEYVYLVTDSGEDGSFKGFHNTINQGVDAPYQVCTVHTQQAWEEYKASQVPESDDNGIPGITDIIGSIGDFIGSIGRHNAGE